MTAFLPSPEAAIAKDRKIRLVLDAFLPARLHALSAYAGAILEPPRDLLFADLRAAENNGGPVYRAAPALGIAPGASSTVQDGASTQTLTQTLTVLVLLSVDYPVTYATSLTEAYVCAVIETLCAYLPDPVGGAGCAGCTGIFSVRQTSSAQGSPVRVGDQDYMITAQASVEIQQRQRYAFGSSAWGVDTSPHHQSSVVDLERATLDWAGDVIALDSRTTGAVELEPPAGPVTLTLDVPIDGTLTVRAQPTALVETAAIVGGVTTVDLSGLAVPGRLLTLTALDSLSGAAHTFVVRVVDPPS